MNERERMIAALRAVVDRIGILDTGMHDVGARCLDALESATGERPVVPWDGPRCGYCGAPWEPTDETGWTCSHCYGT